MRKGPRWSEENVSAMLVVLRSKVEAIDEMSEERLSEECERRLELKKYAKEDRKVKVTALRDWAWSHATGVGVVVGETNSVKGEMAVGMNEDLEKVIELLRVNGSATEGGIRNAVFSGREKAMDTVLAMGYSTGKVKKDKTTSGTEVIVLS